MMIGHLACLGVCVQRSRLRASVLHINLHQHTTVKSVVIRRRVHHSSDPYTLWLIAGNHKLVFGGDLSYMRRLIVFQEQLIHLKMSSIYMEMSVKITCIYANNFQVREIYSNMLGDI